jgi:hypothetical protein
MIATIQVRRRECHAVDVSIVGGQNDVLRRDLEHLRSGIDTSKSQRSTDSLSWITKRVHKLAFRSCAPCRRRRRTVGSSGQLRDAIKEFMPPLAGEPCGSIATPYGTSSFRLEFCRLAEVQPL